MRAGQLSNLTRKVNCEEPAMKCDLEGVHVIYNAIVAFKCSSPIAGD